MAAIKKKENKAADTIDTEVMNNDVQKAEEINEEVSKEVGEEISEKVGEETVLTDNTEKDITGESGDTVVTVDTSVTTEEAPQSEKMVKIKPNCNYRFFYGTKWYVLCKDVVMTVPVEVKERLQNAGKLSAL